MASGYGAWQGVQQATAQGPALGMNIIGMRERQEDRDLTRAYLSENAAARTQMAKDALKLREQQAMEARAKLEVHKQPFNPDELTMSQKAAMTAYGPEGGKAWQPLYDTIRPIVESNPNSTKGDAYQAALSAWPAIREEMKTSLEKTLSNAKLDPIKEKQLREVYNAVVYDQTGENVLGNGVFKNTARAMKMEEENSKAALAQVKQEGYDKLLASKESENEKNRQQRLLLEAMKEGRKGGSGEKEEKKEVKTKIAEVNAYIRKTTANRQKWLKEYEKDPNSDYGKKMMAEIDNFDAQLAIAEDTLAGLQDGSIDPKTVKSGGGKSTSSGDNRSVKLVEDGWGYLGGDKADPKNWKKMP